jgi:hypothetical protein
VSLLSEMASLLPGARLTPGDKASRLVFEVDGCWLDARCRDMPLIEVFIRTLAIDDFELRLQPGGPSLRLDVERHVGNDGFPVYHDHEVAAAIAAAHARLTFEHYEVDQRHDAIAAIWLDDPARAALVDALWLRPDPGVFGMSAVANGYRFLVEKGEVLVKRDHETDPERLARAVHAGGMLAARPHRIARQWLDVARTLGGTTTTDRWDLAKDFAVTVERSPVTVRIDNVGDPLRTRARATRLGDDRDWKAVAALLDAAAPDKTHLTDGEVELRWKGLMMDPARLGPAVEICARLAAPSIAATGPYR